jgi:hypothetical protein
MARLGEPGHVFAPRDVYTGNASLRAEVLREVGGFDESFTIYGNEDVELSVRLHRAGVTFSFDPEALARQEYSKDLRALARDNLAKGATAVMLARSHPDVFGRLRLAAPGDSSRPWLAARALLLAVTRRWSGTSRVVFGAAAALERLGFWRRPLFYRALLDYAFWAGVDATIDPDSDHGPLVALHDELRRGPLDLLRR